MFSSWAEGKVQLPRKDTLFKTQLTERVLRELIEMELKARVLCGVFVLLVSMCYLCEARWIDKTDQGSIPDIDRKAQLLLNESGNATNLTGRFAHLFDFTRDVKSTNIR